MNGCAWPSVLTVLKIEEDERLLKSAVRWIKSMRRAKRVKRRFLLCSAEVEEEEEREEEEGEEGEKVVEREEEEGEKVEEEEREEGEKVEEGEREEEREKKRKKEEERERRKEELAACLDAVQRCVQSLQKQW